jgi:60 kDa SS-A/Ro ribonucleoprotein
MFQAWLELQKRNKNAKLVCIDVTPKADAQVQERENILQVGGFSDHVFNVISSFLEAGHNKNHWVQVIEKVEI